MSISEDQLWLHVESENFKILSDRKCYSPTREGQQMVTSAILGFDGKVIVVEIDHVPDGM